MKPARTSKRWYKTLSGIAKVLNILAVMALMLAYLSAHVSPVKSVIPVFFGLSFPLWVILNVLFVIFWAFNRKFFALVSLAALIIGAGHLKQMVGTGGGKNAEAGDSTIKVLSYNTRLFDVYNFRANADAGNHKKIYSFIEQQQANILCFQEFYTEDTEEMNVLESILEVQPAKNYHVDFFQTRRKDYHWGIATFTTYPVLNRQRFQFRNSTGNYCIFTDVLFQNDTIRIFNTHLESWHFEENDYRFLKSINPPEEELSMNLKNIYWKIETAYIKRAVQIQELKELIEQSPFPVIVCGDFNDTPMSYTYHLMNKILSDSFVEKGKGMGKTYRQGLPHFRIDYIFHDAAFSTQSFTTHKVAYSDHFPVSALLKYEGRQP